MPTIVEEYYVEMAWDCATCKTQNPGRSKICSNCGKPLAREEFRDESDRPTTIDDRVTSEEFISQASAGADWECKFCGSHQRRGNGECATCGSNEKLSAGHGKYFNDKEPVDFHEETRPEITPSAPDKETLEKRYAELNTKVQHEARSRRHKSILILGCGFLGFATLVTFLVWLFTPRYLDAKIIDVYYQHVIQVERNIESIQHGFDTDSDAYDVVQDGEKIHHRDQVQDGWDPPVNRPITVKDPDYCYITPIVKSDGECVTQKNGFKKCTKITSGGDKKCEPRSHKEDNWEKVPHIKLVPVYRAWYTWKVRRWTYNRSIPISAHTNEVMWPSDQEIALNRNCGPGETERFYRDASYSVTFGDDKDSWKYKPSSLEEYQSLKLGSIRHLKLVAGMITVLP